MGCMGILLLLFGGIPYSIYLGGTIPKLGEEDPPEHSFRALGFRAEGFRV